MTGAIGVVVLMLSASISLVVSAVTIVVARLRRRGVPRRIAARVLLAGVGGVPVGALAHSSNALVVGLGLIVLVGVAVSLGWCWRVLPER